MKLSAKMKPKTTLRKVGLNYTHASPNADSDVIKNLKMMKLAMTFRSRLIKMMHVL